MKLCSLYVSIFITFLSRDLLKSAYILYKVNEGYNSPERIDQYSLGCQLFTISCHIKAAHILFNIH